jgi:hypothetical protein
MSTMLVLSPGCCLRGLEQELESSHELESPVEEVAREELEKDSPPVCVDE